MRVCDCNFQKECVSLRRHQNKILIPLKYKEKRAVNEIYHSYINNKEHHCISCCWSAYNITVICLSKMKRLRVLENISKCIPAFQMNWDLKVLVFEEGKKTEYIREKPLKGREITNNKLNPHTALMPGFQPGHHWWEARALFSPLCSPCSPYTIFLLFLSGIECLL